MRILRHDQKNFKKRAGELFSRRAIASGALRELVADIIGKVEKGGDRAVLELTRRFDKVKLDNNSMSVSGVELREARGKVAPETRDAIAACRVNVVAFAEKSLRQDWSMKNSQGVRVGEVFQAFDRVGIYVPGGTAPLVSTSLMTVAIARVAGVREIAVCTPPAADASVNPNLLYALEIAGATEIYKIGGAQAIAALGCGTESIAAVDKVFGPGNSFVVEAKRQMFGRVSVDLLPGPSEILIIADASARADWVAADLLAQAEHGGDSQVALLSNSSKLLEGVKRELKMQSKGLRRQAQIREVLRSGTTLVLVKSLSQAIKLANDFAAEHVSLVVRNEEKILPKIRTAGAIFVGSHSPVALGDFLAGPSHTLPTGGAGKSFSGLTTEMFQRRTSIVKAGAKAMRRSVAAVEAFANVEGLDAHGRSATIRFDD
ncbi:MAG: histidinol dehydrogenase [Verrucomicrobiales bacterium]